MTCIRPGECAVSQESIRDPCSSLILEKNLRPAPASAGLFVSLFVSPRQPIDQNGRAFDQLGERGGVGKFVGRVRALTACAEAVERRQDGRHERDVAGAAFLGVEELHLAEAAAGAVEKMPAE